ncbi:MAG: hypothetical protein ABL897_08400 [Hyphomicrobium sp.]
MFWRKKPSAPAIDFPTHPLADLFPMADEGAFSLMVECIRTDGLREPIALMGGKIIDGRNRFKACLEAGVQPRFTDFPGSEADAVRFVAGANRARRHMTERQRSIVGGKLVDMLSISLDEAAERMAVSRSSIVRARRVLASGDAELIASVESGAVPINVAAEAARGASGPSVDTKAVRFSRGLRKLLAECEGLEAETLAELAALGQCLKSISPRQSSHLRSVK